MKLGEIIFNFRKQNNLSLRDFAQRCDLSYTYISMIEKGEDYRTGKSLSPTLDAVKKLAKALGMSIDELIQAMDNQDIDLKDTAPIFLDNANNKSAVVFVYGVIPAGIPIECIEDIIDTEEIPVDMLKGGKQFFGLRVKGNSMNPEYLDGDTIILEKVDDCDSGQDCVVMVNGSDGTFKRVFKDQNGVILQPLNPAFSPMVYTNEQIQKLPIKIIGKVVELRRKK